jgi:hypothetical protein
VLLDEISLLFDFGEQMIVGIVVLDLHEPLLGLPRLHSKFSLDPASVGR